MENKILLVDDEVNVRRAVQRALRKEPYEILCASSGQEALDLLTRHSVEVVVSDEKMPGMSGSELLASVASRYPDTVRIMLTGQASLEAAVRAINKGEIYRFLTKPWDGVDLVVTIRQALRLQQILAEGRRLVVWVASPFRMVTPGTGKSVCVSVGAHWVTRSSTVSTPSIRTAFPTTPSILA